MICPAWSNIQRNIFHSLQQYYIVSALQGAHGMHIPCAKRVCCQGFPWTGLSVMEPAKTSEPDREARSLWTPDWDHISFCFWVMCLFISVARVSWWPKELCDTLTFLWLQAGDKFYSEWMPSYRVIRCPDVKHTHIFPLWAVPFVLKMKTVWLSSEMWHLKQLFILQRPSVQHNTNGVTTIDCN